MFWLRNKRSWPGGPGVSDYLKIHEQLAMQRDYSTLCQLSRFGINHPLYMGTVKALARQ